MKIQPYKYSLSQIYRNNYKRYDQAETGPDWNFRTNDYTVNVYSLPQEIKTDSFTDSFTDNSISSDEIILTHNIEDKIMNGDFLIDQDFFLRAKLTFDYQLRDLS